MKLYHFDLDKCLASNSSIYPLGFRRPPYGRVRNHTFGLLAGKLFQMGTNEMSGPLGHSHCSAFQGFPYSAQASVNYETDADFGHRPQAVECILHVQYFSYWKGKLAFPGFSALPYKTPGLPPGKFGQPRPHGMY